MKHLPRILFFLLVFLIVLLAIFYFSLPFFVKKDTVQTYIVQVVEESTEGNFVYEQSEFSYFPILTLRFKDVEFRWTDEEEHIFTADKVQIRFNMFSLLIGQFKVWKMEVRGGETSLTQMMGKTVDPLPIDNLDLNIYSLEKNAPVKIQFEADLAGMPKALSGDLTVQVEQWRKWDWFNTALGGKLALNHLDLNKLSEWIQKNWSWNVVGGILSVQLDLKKKKNEGWADAKAVLDAEEFIYEGVQNGNVVSSPPLDLKGQFDLGWNQRGQQIVIRKGALQSPMGDAEVNGTIAMETGEIKQLRWTFSRIILEAVPQYWISLNDKIPFNMGFSGYADFEMTFQGPWDHLMLNANFDLTDAILTYARYFSKPKGIPMNLGFDLLLKEGKTLGGDFSVRFQEATIKGNLKEFNVVSGEGQISLLTNKFQLEGWESLLIPFQDYQLQGEIKILANWDGKLNSTDNSQTVINVTVDNANLLHQNQPAVENFNLVLDYSSIGLVIKQASFVIADSPMAMELSIYSADGNPVVQGKILSQHLQPFFVFQNLETWLPEWTSPELWEKLQPFKNAFADFFPEGEMIESFNMGFDYRDNKWRIQKAQMNAYGGQIQFQAELDLNQPTRTYDFSGEVNKLSLARFFHRGGRETGSMEGNMFLKVDLQGSQLGEPDWQTLLTGQGSLMITNGKIESFDLFKTISQQNEFKSLATYSTHGTLFNDLNASFDVKDTKMITDKLTIIAPDFMAEGSGSLSLDWVLNSRLDVYLSPEVTTKLMTSFFGSDQNVMNQQFGPIPLLASGPFEKPELKLDPQRISKLTQEFRDQKTQDVLRTFLPEKTFFDRRNNS